MADIHGREEQADGGKMEAKLHLSRGVEAKLDPTPPSSTFPSRVKGGGYGQASP